MRCRAGVSHGVGEDRSIEEIEVDSPKAGEVLVTWTRAGMCHCDEHIVAGDIVPPPAALELMGSPGLLPIIGGHEGAGIIAEVGPGVTSVQPGDHVPTSFVPSRGTRRYCSRGQQNLCDQGAGAFLPGMITDGTSRHRTPDAELMLFAKLGTFWEYSCVAESHDGTLELDGLISSTDTLHEIDLGYGAMRDGTNTRGVIAHAT